MVAFLLFLKRLTIVLRRTHYLRITYYAIRSNDVENLMIRIVIPCYCDGDILVRFIIRFYSYFSYLYQTIWTTNVYKPLNLVMIFDIMFMLSLNVLQKIYEMMCGCLMHDITLRRCYDFYVHSMKLNLGHVNIVSSSCYLII